MDHRPLSVLSLCAGVGGLDLGIRVAQPDACTVCYVEIEAFACEILATRMEDKTMDEAPVWTDLRSFNGKPWRGCVDIVTAGYPCQPFSVAGKQKGKDDPRHLWPDVFRVVREVRPKICFFENVSGHLRLGFEQLHDDLSGLGYSVKAGLFSAQEVGSSHKRERLFILAYRESDYRSGWLSEIRERGSAYPGRQPSMADSPCLFCERPEPEGNHERQSEMSSGSLGGELAYAYHAGFQETGTEFFTERTGRDIRQLGNAEYAGSSASQITRGTGKDDGAQRSACGQIPPEQSARTNYVADSDGARFQEQCGTEPIFPQHETAECGSCLPFPPRPEGDWDGIPAGLKPAICRMADGLAHRVDRIRACGNGVVPLAAAHAWGVLTTAANGGK